MKSLLIAALSAVGLSAFAQTKNVVLDTKGMEPLPYAVDARGVITRSGTGLCWRTGYWTQELAAKTPVVGSEFPAGCECDKDLMPKAVCEPAAKKAAEAPEPVAPAPVAAVKPSAEKITVAADALFDFDKADLRAEGKAKLDDVASKASTLKIEAITAVGHADRFGTDKYNQKLSERRANSVKDYLVKKGIAADRIYAEGKGKTQPVTKPDQCKGPKSKKVIACLQPDRRVVIEVIGTK
ncbi:OmpA family protein [Georgfuchsia toluolica]|nr:OmpA family protein [Georgfuchsia toluolica]